LNHPTHYAEIISIGDELTSGQRLDTNSQWISQQLAELGVPVLYHTTVADQLDANVAVMRMAAQRATIVIVTGGLGPTDDDLTREALSRAAQRPLLQDDASLQHITELFHRRNRKMPAKNIVQALLPEGSAVIFNEQGTAPGIDLTFTVDQHTSRFFCLPGVPAEMKTMFDQTVVPAVQEMQPTSRHLIRHYILKTFGLGESDIEQKLPDLFRRDRVPSVGITASHATITLRITATGNSEADCQSIAQPTIDKVGESLGTLIYAHRECELEDVVLEILQQRQETLCVWECGTRGRLTSMLQQPQNASFVSGLFSDQDQYSPSSSDPSPTERLLEHVESMRERVQATYGLGVGPVTTDPDTDTPLIEVVLAWNGGHVANHHPFTGHPDILHTKAAKQAINQLRLHLRAL